MEKILSNHSEMTIEHIPVPWARAQKMVKNGQAHGMVTTPTPERLEYSYRSKNSVFLLPFVAVTHAEDRRFMQELDPDTLALYRDKVFCDVLGNGWADNFYRDKPVKVHTVPTITECLKLLAARRVVGIVHAQPVLKLYIENLGLEDTLKLHDIASKLSPEFPLLISKKVKNAKEIIASFDKHFNEDRHIIRLDRRTPKVIQ